MDWSKFELLPWRKLNKQRCPDDLILICYDYDGHQCFDVGCFIEQREDEFEWDGRQGLGLDEIIAWCPIHGPKKDYRLEADESEGDNDKT